MKQELAWGTAATVAIVAAVGISSQPGGRPDASSSAGKPSGQTIVTTKAPKQGAPEKGVQPQCEDSIPLLEHFFLHEKITGPPSCYEGQPIATPLDSNYQTEFVIATLPDPLHTHSSLLFDRLVEAIQEGAQDENYEYDSSWLPWETEEPSLVLLKDQDDAEDRKQKREDQPGILIFRGAARPSDKNGKSPYQKALIVLIVGEESTSGIHRQQFENAVAWIKALQRPGDKRTSVAILGPTFSGTFASLGALLARTDGINSLNAGAGFSVYSGSATSLQDGEDFAKIDSVRFRSFVQDDTTALNRMCQYFGRRFSDNLAILSEDETAYGSIVAKKNFASEPNSFSGTCAGAINIFYPRDISTLRAAYQSQSMFTSGSGQGNSDNAPHKSLPTDLADPAGEQHDTVRRYAGNQTPLSQEAQLMGIVDALRTHHVEYVIIRSSSTLDPLFLANFLRRDYPEARILILNSDLLFQRGQDAMGMSGVMTMSTYPLFSRARQWITLPFPDTHSHRVFPENSTEGTYIASRLLLQTLARENGRTPHLNCEFADKNSAVQDRQIFAPALRCEPKSPIFASLPDYAPPFWTDPHACELTSSDLTCRPPMWLSVITRNGTSPLAALNDRTLTPGAAGTSRPPTDSAEHGSWPGTPRSTKLFLVMLCGLAVFHFLCCRFASFTAKPAFRAHFADARNNWLVLIGSYLITLLALFVGWGSGMFSAVPSPPALSWQVLLVVIFVCCLSAAAIVVNVLTTRRLNGNAGIEPGFKLRMIISLGLFAISIGGFFLLWIRPIEGGLLLANRAFVYWRSMHLTSGVSPLVPFLSLTAGLYVWFWYALHGLALFGPDRPRLPLSEKLVVKFPTLEPVKPGQPTELTLSMFSHENVAEPAEELAKPLAWANVIVTATVFVLLGALLFGLRRGVPIRSLGSTSNYAIIFFFAMVFYCSFILSEGWKIKRTWSSVRQLLVFLDRMALRRTLSALHGFSWGNVWKMSGNVLDVRYKLLSRQLECLNHLYNSLSSPGAGGPAIADVAPCKDSVKKSLEASRHFADWYSKNYNDPKAAGLQKFQFLQEQVAETTGVVLTELLVPATRSETQSLIQVDPDDDCDDDRISPPQSKDELIRNAEELICLTYLGFAQNLLGRIRTIVLGAVYLFIALSIAVSSYPFDPRTLLSAILLVSFVAFGGIVISTYADMHRDATLSHLTNTKPGELGSEFWFKVIGYGAAPLLGLITQVFPEWSGFLFSWLQPGLSSLR